MCRARFTSPALPVEYETFGVVPVKAVTDATTITEPPSPCFTILSKTVLASEVLPFVVHIVGTIPNFFGQFVQVAIFVVHLDTGVRHEDVQTAEPFHGLRNGRFNLFRI